VARSGIISSGEILHCVAIRARATGSGSLRTSLYSLQAVNFQDLANLTLADPTNKEDTNLANFEDQYIQISMAISGLDQYFNISRIVAFVKPTAAEYPR
jgi:hypothetical protein